MKTVLNRIVIAGALLLIFRFVLVPFLTVGDEPIIVTSTVLGENKSLGLKSDSSYYIRLTLPNDNLAALDDILSGQYDQALLALMHQLKEQRKAFYLALFPNMNLLVTERGHQQRVNDSFRYVVTFFNNHHFTMVNWAYETALYPKLNRIWTDPLSYYPGDDLCQLVALNLSEAPLKLMPEDTNLESLLYDYSPYPDLRSPKPYLLIDVPKRLLTDDIDKQRYNSLRQVFKIIGYDESESVSLFSVWDKIKFRYIGLRPELEIERGAEHYNGKRDYTLRRSGPVITVRDNSIVTHDDLFQADHLEITFDREGASHPDFYIELNESEWIVWDGFNYEERFRQAYSTSHIEINVLLFARELYKANKESLHIRATDIDSDHPQKASRLVINPE